MSQVIWRPSARANVVHTYILSNAAGAHLVLTENYCLFISVTILQAKFCLTFDTICQMLLLYTYYQ